MKPIAFVTFLVVSFGAALSASAQQKVAHFGINRLECFQTTELGQDEVYLVISGRWDNGHEFKFRAPGASHHWDLNDVS